MHATIDCCTRCSCTQASRCNRSECDKIQRFADFFSPIFLIILFTLLFYLPSYDRADRFSKTIRLTVSRGGLQHCGDVLRPLWLLMAEFEAEWRFWRLALSGVTGSSSVVSMSTSSSELSSFWLTSVGRSGMTAGSTMGGPRITGRNADWCKVGLTVGIKGSVGLEPLMGGGSGPANHDRVLPNWDRDDY